VDHRRLRMCFLIISAFLCGGIGGTFAFRHLGYSALIIPGSLTALTAFAYGLYRLYRRRSHSRPNG
jgi:uncharacterized membrane protein YoaK (UPF0700 family)